MVQTNPEGCKHACTQPLTHALLIKENNCPKLL